MNITGELLTCFYPDPLWSQVIAIDQTEFPRPWSMKDWIELRAENHLLLAWVQNGQVLAFSLLGLIPGDASAHLLKICVRSSHRSTGLAQIFWNGITSKLSKLGVTEIYLEVEDSNSRAIIFYQKVGFLQLRRVNKFYSDGAGALIFQLTL